MKKYAFVCGALLLAATLSCTREQGDNLPQKMTFQAVWADEADTRTAIQPDGTSVWWSPKEEIAVLAGNYSIGRFMSTNTTPQATVTFEGSMSSSLSLLAVYPYQEGYYREDDCIVNLEIHPVQQGKEGTFADREFPAMCFVEGDMLRFRHICGGVRFSVANEGICSVTFESIGGEPLAGYVTVRFAEDGPVVTEISSNVGCYSQAVTVIAPDGGFTPGQYYFAAFIPGTLSQGLNVIYTKPDGSSADIALNKSITVRRARFGTVEAMDAGLTFRHAGINTPAAVDLGLSVKWASFNLGAKRPEETGHYYAWGEMEPKTIYDWATYQWGEGSDDLKKYNGDSDYGPVDYKEQLEPEDDAAHVKLGDKWRMPTEAELTELMDTQYDSRYAWSFKSTGGVEGVEIVHLASGNHIFLPKSGCKIMTQITQSDQVRLWSSSLMTSRPVTARYAYVTFSGDSFWTGKSGGSRGYGYCIRPVYGDLPAVIPVESIVLERSQLVLYPGVEFDMKSEVLPENAGNKNIIWSSSDESVATVNTKGYIMGVAQGKATITAASVDGTRTATCQVTVQGPVTTITTPDAIDLGLSVKWASFNLGATRPEESGNYYAWGEIEPKTAFEVWNYKWLDANSRTYTKYNSVDNLCQLEAEDDVAHVELGGNWRIPTKAELQELLDTWYNEGYRWQYKAVNGVPGFEIECLSNHNSLFLPFSGFIHNTEPLLNGSSHFSTSSLGERGPEGAYVGVIDPGPSFGPDGDYLITMTSLSRCFGFPVRPVCN